jgi:hypothetical protein
MESSICTRSLGPRARRPLLRRPARPPLREHFSGPGRPIGARRCERSGWRHTPRLVLHVPRHLASWDQVPGTLTARDHPPVTKKWRASGSGPAYTLIARPVCREQALPSPTRKATDSSRVNSPVRRTGTSARPRVGSAGMITSPSAGAKLLLGGHLQCNRPNFGSGGFRWYCRDPDCLWR